MPSCQRILTITRGPSFAGHLSPAVGFFDKFLRFNFSHSLIFFFLDEEFDVQGFGDYEYEDYEDYDELDYGNFEGNDIDNDVDEEDRRGRSMDFDEKNTSKLAKLETDLKKEMSKTEKLRAEIAALKASMEKSNSDVKGRRGKKKNPTEVSKAMTLARTTKKQVHCGRLFCGPIIT